MWVLFFFFGFTSISVVFYVRPPYTHTIGYMIYQPKDRHRFGGRVIF